MRRIFFHTACHLSFVLLVCLCVLWLRGNWTRDLLIINKGPQTRWGLDAGRGELTLWHRFSSRPNDHESWMQFDVYDADMRQRMIGGNAPTWSALGFELGQYERSRGSQITSWFSMPLWFVALLLSILPLLRVRSRRGLERVLTRAASGHCPHCGYDLRVTQSITCPECGNKRWLEA